MGDRNVEENMVNRLTGTSLPLPSGPVIRFLGLEEGVATWEAPQVVMVLQSAPPPSLTGKGKKPWLYEESSQQSWVSCLYSP